MKTLRRYKRTDVMYFITSVTYLRRHLLLDDVDLFFICWSKQELHAWVLMPDHFHTIIEVGAQDISDILHRFKITYSRRYRDVDGPGRVWQNRFWDHIIRDESEYRHFMDYIHYNPVKHGFVKSPSDFEHSSFRRWCENGAYESDWGTTEKMVFDGEYGE